MSAVRPALVAGLAALLGLGGALGGIPGAGDARAATVTAVVERDLTVPVGAEPDGTAVTIDATVARPAQPTAGTPQRFPVVLLAHGFGGSKADLLERGRDLASRGFVAISYSARGFGASGGRIHLDDPVFEVADARALVDRVAGEPDVLHDAPGDPRIAVAGASYGGALALMLGATDPRIDSVVASVTWNDLAEAFFPQGASTLAQPDDAAALAPVADTGVLKSLWASRFFGSGLAAGGSSADPSASPGAAALCGRMDPEVCRLFRSAVEAGSPSPELLALLRAHSPRPLLGGLRVSTMLVQGMRDTLFGLDQADETARAIAGQVPRLAVRWIDGGHDGASSTGDADEQAVRDWLDQTLRGAAVPASPTARSGFVYAAPIPRRQSIAPLIGLDGYPGTASWSTIPWASEAPQVLLNPPGGQPESVSVIPTVAGLPTGAAAYQLAALPGQSAAFDTRPLTTRISVAGSPRLTLAITSTGTEAVLFLSLWQVTAETATLPRRLVTPIRVATVPGQPTTVEVALPAATWTVEAGSRLRVLVTTTDSMYAGPRTARSDRIAVAGTGLRLPDLPGVVIARESDLDTESIGVGLVILALLLVGAGSFWWERRRRRRRPARPELADVPLVVDGLVKRYADGHRAVDGVSWRAERGQVVGLLGPNGAGKTTTLRMVLGLVHPDDGTAYVSGQPIQPGSAALADVGALVEGPGFLPHLSGRDNLRAFWAATGRPDDEAGYAEALEVAALGDAVDRPVRSYSHGMRQRLGIAQAVLGRPALLVLDEPTNGLDPPQIAAMRPILQRYAASGRTVVVSSHLLAEVEQTCSHVVVMHAGRVVATGAVADLVDSSTSTVVSLDPATDPGEVAAVADRLAAVSGIDAVEVVADEGEPRLVVDSRMPRADVIRALAGVGADVVGVSSRRHLEEVFLGVIAEARHAGRDESLTEQLRQVRAR